MADTKISALPASTTPLAGTEVLPVVQGGVTKQVSVANLTAGRAVATAGGSFTDNITQSTASKGIDFTANTPAAGMTSQLLNWYEEGTWTPTWSGGTVTVNNARFTRVGRVVTICADLTFGASADATDATLTLPFNVDTVWGTGSINYTNYGPSLVVNIEPASDKLLFRGAFGGGNLLSTNIATKRVIFSAMYFA